MQDNCSLDMQALKSKETLQFQVVYFARTALGLSAKDIKSYR
jgi:hypothetical protein